MMNAPQASTFDLPQRETKRVNISTSLSTLSPTHHEVMSTTTYPLQPDMQGGRPLTMHEQAMMNAPQTSTCASPQRETKRVNISNSLSTLNPTHHEVMSTTTYPAQPGMQGGRPLTMHDVIQWQLEQAQRLGEMGLSTNFPDPSDIFKPFTIDVSGDELLTEDRGSLRATMLETHKAIIQVHQRKIIMDGAGPLLAKTEDYVDKRLLAAGVPKQDFQNKSLRQKIVQLAELQKPPPKENFAAILVAVPSAAAKGGSHILEVNLPLKASVEEIYELLDEVVEALLSEKGLLYERALGGTWKYQLMDQSRSRLLLEKSLPLKSNLDYDMMLQQVSGVDDAKPPVAVLTQVCLCHAIERKCMDNVNAHMYVRQGGLARPIDISGVNAKAETLVEDDDGLEILDEDGEPFFEALDMDRMARKYGSIGDDLTGNNGIHGFWR